MTPVRRVLQTLYDVGLGYIKLGQPAPTLSGGEAQRIKLAKELCRRSTGRTLYILDEPTTGLHFADVDKLLRILHTFADQGNSVVVVEHNMEVIKTADYILDLGPEGGEDGGWIIAAGPPEAVAQNEQSHTGHALKQALKPQRAALPAAATTGHREDNGWIREIEILGANQHNLRNIDVKIPRDQLTVISGVSGSGKSSLAFDTLYAEGQRRYVESLSAYARQFLEQMQKPKVERVSGLSPAIAIEQKAPSRNPRSTVGTVTEVYDYIRALYAALGTQYCPRCQVPAGTQTAQEMVERIVQMPSGRRILILAPIEPRQNEGYETLLARARSDGFLRARIDGTVHDLREDNPTRAPTSPPHRTRRRSPRRPRQRPRPPHRIRRARPRVRGRRVGRSLARRRNRGTLQPPLLLPRVWPGLLAPVAAVLLLQPPAGHVPSLRGAGAGAGRRSRAGRSAASQRARGGHPRLGAGARPRICPPALRRGGGLGLQLGRAVCRARARGPSRPALRRI